MDVLRWWFTLRRDVIERNENGDAFVFPKQTVRLQSENERITDRGDRIHTGRSTALNQLFAARFTKHYDRLSKQYPVYAQLESLFRMSIVATLIQSDEVQSQIDWDPSWLISALSPATGITPKEVPSIVNHRTVNRRQIVVGVSGGVSVNARRATASIRTARDTGNLASGRNTAFPRSPRDSERWWWD
jgi:hypothetical protein